MSDGQRKRRLFAGVELPDDARERCAAVTQALRATGIAAKFEAPEKLHVTLAFLGFVESERMPELASALQAAASLCRPLTIVLEKVGAFPHERRPRVVYIGSREQGSHFRAVAAATRNAYERLGFVFREDVVAHVTIARIRESKRPLPLVEFEPIAVAVDSLALFESLPDPARRTSRYEVVMRAALG